ncbi:MAG: hypothetical protein HPY83_02640 [Anaerolineae bacterium]|nr:hypothetical protein [Anaerolineae bacterium]
MLRGLRLKVLVAVVLGLAVLASPTLASAQEGQWYAEYYSNPWLTGPPSVTRNESALSFDWGYGSPDGRIPSDNWSARWTGTLHLQAGLWRFTTETDDGVRLYVDGRLVIDRWHDMSRTAHSAEVELSEGPHHVRMEYYEHMGAAFARLTWEWLGVPAHGGNIITAVRPYGSSWIKVYRWEDGKWLDVNPRGYGRIDANGFLKLDGFPVDMWRYGGNGHPYKVELWAEGSLVASVGDTARGEPEFRVYPATDSYTPWQVPAP